MPSPPAISEEFGDELPVGIVAINDTVTNFAYEIQRQSEPVVPMRDMHLALSSDMSDSKESHIRPMSYPS